MLIEWPAEMPAIRFDQASQSFSLMSSRSCGAVRIKSPNLIG
jgi:hypothetical protein